MRDIEIILEEINRKLELVIEGYEMLDKKLDDMKRELVQKLDEMESLIRVFLRIKGDIRVVDKKIDNPGLN